MSNPSVVISSYSDILTLRDKISQNISDTSNFLRTYLEKSNDVSLLRALKFEKAVTDPLFGYDTNFIEYLNQLFTYMVEIAAVSKLLKYYPEYSFQLNLGTRNGYDIISSDENVICECFASTSPRSNMKLKKDADKVASNLTATIKYLAFYCENVDEKYINSLKIKYQSISFLNISWNELLSIIS